MTIRPKSESELDIMREAGRKLSQVLRQSDQFISPGTSLNEIDSFIDSLIVKLGAKPSFKGYKGYPASSCLSVNAVVVHGIPTKYVLKEGDCIGIDVGLEWEGYHTDSAFTKPVGQVDSDIQTLIKITQMSLRIGIAASVAGNTVGDIGSAIEQYITTQGHYGIIRDLTGHGIGASLQEMPEIPNYANNDATVLVNGMTLAIEPMVSLGSFKVHSLPDHWSVETIDHSPTAHFESTIVVHDADPEILVDFPLSFPVDQKSRLW